MEKNTKSEEEIVKEKIKKYKENLKFRDHLKNVGIIFCFAIPGFIISYVFAGWLGFVAVLFGVFIVLIMRYTIKSLLLPWELLELMKTMGYFEAKKTY